MNLGTKKRAKSYYIVCDYVFNSIDKAAWFAVAYAEKYRCAYPEISIRRMNSTNHYGYAEIDCYTDELWVNGKATGMCYNHKTMLKENLYIVEEAEIMVADANIEHIEAQAISTAYNNHDKDIDKTAQFLGLSNTTLKRKLRQYKIK